MSEANNTRKNPENELITMRDLATLFLPRWRWFVLSMVVAVSVAAIYLSVTPAIYTRSASVLIKDDSQSSSALSAENAFADMGLFQSNTNIQNEILTLQAPILMEEVVKRLDLDANYTVTERFKEKVLYKDSPVRVVWEQGDVYRNLSFRIDLLPENRVALSRFMLDDEEVDGDEVNGQLLDTLSTPLGKLILLPTESYSNKELDTPIAYSQSSVQSAASRYTEALTVALADEKATVVSLSINDVSTPRAEDILNTLISIYNENWIKNKNQITISTSRFIGERLGVIEEELGGVDNDISSFKSKNLLPDVASVSEKYLSQSGENEKNILVLNTQLAMARYIGNYLRHDVTLNQLLPANSGVDNMKVESQIAEYNTLLLQRNNLQANSSAKNPLVIDMNHSLASMKEAIIRSVDDLIAILAIQIDKITISETKNLGKLASNPNQVKYLLSVERQQKVKEALYLFLLQKREENELSQTFTAYNTTVVNPPQGNPFPIAPKKSLILLVAFVIGLLLPAIILYLIESMNTLVRSRKDLEVLTIPFIGEIPLAVGEKKRRFSCKKEPLPSSVVIEEKSRNVINEAFRIVRTNIDFMRGKAEQRTVIMTTSVHSGSGKTFISTNLAISMAVKGAKVLVLDADLRKATFSTLVDSPAKGLSDYLNGSITNVNEVIVRGTLHRHLNVIPVGTIPPNPSELLLSTRFEELIQRLRSEYDYIFIDCPPVEVVTDAAIIAKLCDLTLFIIRAGLMDRRTLPEVEDIYVSNRLNKMCVILNGLEYTGSKYGYRRYGYSSYGYGKYGYGE